MKEVFLRGAFSENHSLYLFGGLGGTDADKTGYYLENGAFLQRKNGEPTDWYIAGTRIIGTAAIFISVFCAVIFFVF